MGIQWIAQGSWWDLLTGIKGCFSFLHFLFPYSQSLKKKKIQRVRFSCVKHQGGAAVHQRRSQNLEKFYFLWEIYILFPNLETAVCICIFPRRTAPSPNHIFCLLLEQWEFLRYSFDFLNHVVRSICCHLFNFTRLCCVNCKRMEVGCVAPPSQQEHLQGHRSSTKVSFSWHSTHKPCVI